MTASRKQRDARRQWWCEVCGENRLADGGGCTNGRCRQCHNEFCVWGVSTEPGHGRGVIATPFQNAPPHREAGTRWKARAETAEARCARLEKALRAVFARWRAPDESPNDYFERQAAEFYRKSGMLAPGKDDPEPASEEYNIRRATAWREFYNQPY